VSRGKKGVGKGLVGGGRIGGGGGFGEVLKVGLARVSGVGREWGGSLNIAGGGVGAWVGG